MRPRNSGLIGWARAARLGIAVCGGLLFAALPARAAEVDYGKLFLERGLKCLHPTAKVDTAKVEVLKGPERTGELSTVRLRVYYSTLIKKHTMDVEFLIREAGSIRQMKLNVLADTATEVGTCELTKNWADF